MKFKKKNYTPQVDEKDCGCAALSMILKTYETEKSLASFLLNQRIKMHKVFEKIITIFFAFFLFFIHHHFFIHINNLL